MPLNRVGNVLQDAWLSWQYLTLSYQSEFTPENALVLTGDPRGGTTWLSEIINKIPATALLWEPLAPSRVPQFGDLGFSWRQYIPENEEWHEAKQLFDRLFSGRLLSPYLCQSTSPDEIRKAHFLVVKFCRATQLLPWLTKQFLFKYPPIYLVRHPCAVIASQLKQGGWTHVKPQFTIPDGKYVSFYSQHTSFLETVNTVEKRLAATWCLCNEVPLTHPENNLRWITLTYESLLQDPAKQLQRIASRWGIPLPQDVSAGALKASTTTVKGSPIQSGNTGDQLSYWKRQLSSKQMSDIFSVLDYFRIDLYDSHELPHRQYTG